MIEKGAAVVNGPGGIKGVIDTGGAPRGSSQVLIRLDDGRRLLVPKAAITQAGDGQYRLSMTADQIAAAASGVNQRQDGEGAGTIRRDAEELVVPVIAEELDVQRRVVETGRVRISKVVREHEEVIDEPLLRDEVVIDRVAVNRVVDGPMPARREGDDIILPVVEEVLVIEKRWMLKEELRIKKRRVEVRDPQRVAIREEEVRVERTTRD